MNPALLEMLRSLRKAFYVSNDLGDVANQLKFHKATFEDFIRYKLDLSKAKVLDLTDPIIKTKYGFDKRFTRVYASHQAIAERAGREGYNVIKYGSFRTKGSYNYAVLSDFDQLLS